MKKQSNSNKHLTTYIVVMLSLLVMSSCGQSNQNSDNTDTSDSLASYVSEFDTLYNWEGWYYGRRLLEEELSFGDNEQYSLNIQKDSIIFLLESEILPTRYLLYSKSISPGKIKLLGFKDITEGKTEEGKDDILNKDFGVLSIEKERKKIIWESDYSLLMYNGETNHILLESTEYGRYVDSMTAAVWRIMNVIDSAYKEQWIGSYIADLHYIKEKSYEEYDSIKKELRLDILYDSIKVYINDSVFDYLSVDGNADSVFLYTTIPQGVTCAADRSLGYLYKDKKDRYIWKSDNDDKHISVIFSFISQSFQNDTPDFYVADDSIILNKR